MKQNLQILSWIVLGCVAIFGLAYGSYQMYAFFSPRYTAVDYKGFKESQQYNEGMVRDLENVKMQYLNATPEQKQSLRALTLHRFSVYPKDQLPPDLQLFYSQLQGAQ